MENVLCAIERIVYSPAIGWNVLCVLTRPIWSTRFFGFSSPLFPYRSSIWVFYLWGISIGGYPISNGVLKSVSTIVLLSNSSFSFANLLHLFSCLTLDLYISITVMSSWWVDSFIMM